MSSRLESHTEPLGLVIIQRHSVAVVVDNLQFLPVNATKASDLYSPVPLNHKQLRAI